MSGEHKDARARGSSGRSARVAPVSRPDTHMIADMQRCSMKGRAIVMQTGIQTPASTQLIKFS